jgi:tetratricopeptide (TPR) repeat protein
MSASMPSPRFAPGPYPGLRPFTRDEAEIFFGRDEQIDQLLEKLKVTRFLTVIGSSGCGKSSLVRAGVIADLEGGLMSEAGAHWEFVEMRPGNHPMSALADALLAEEPLRSRLLPRSPSSDEMQPAVGFLRAALRVSPLGLVDALRQSRLPDRTNFLLLVDQFEEVFAARNEGFVDETDAFVALLLATASHRESPLYVVITIRSDYLGNCPVFSCLPEAINQGQYLTPRLDREQRTEAIVGPAKLFGATIDADLLNHLLNETGPSPDQLPLLQHLLMRMWTLASHDGDVPKNSSAKLTLTFDHYVAAGGFEQAISKHAGEAYNELAETQKEIAQVLFRALCERGPDNREKRRLVAVETIAALAGTTPEEVIAVADVFRRPDRSFIMPPACKALSADTDLDISHEALIRNWDKLSEWVSVEAKSAENYLWLEQAARRWKKREAGLFDGFNLKTALAWQRQEKPSKEWAARYGGDFSLTMGFLNRSQEYHRERLRQEAAHHRNVFLGISLALFLALVLAGVSFRQSWRAKQAADKAKKLAEAAETARRQADDLVDFMLFRLRETVKGTGSLGILAEFVTAESDYLQKLSEDAPTAARRRQKAIALSNLGDVLVLEGKLGDALIDYEQSQDIVKRLVDQDKPADQAKINTMWHEDLAISYQRVGDVLKAQGKNAEALQNYQAALAIWKELADRGTSNRGWLKWESGLAAASERIGDILIAHGKIPEALQNYQAEWTIWKQLLDQNETRSLARRLSTNDFPVGRMQQQHVHAYWQTGRAYWQTGRAYSYEKVGDVLKAQGKLPEALQNYQAEGTIWKELVDTEKADTACQSGLAGSYEKVGDVLKAQGKLPEALQNYQAEWTIWKELVDTEKTDTACQSGLAGSYEKVGDVLKAQGKLPEALQNYQAEWTIFNQLADQDKAKANTDWQCELAGSFGKVGDVLKAQGKIPEALGKYQAELTIRKKLVDQDNGNTDWLSGKIAEKLAAEDKTNADVQRELIVATCKVGATLRHREDRNSQEKGQMILQQALDLLKDYFGTDKSNLDILVTEAMQIEGQ